MKDESEKTGSKLDIEKTKVMASSPITSWQRGGEKMKSMKDFIFLDSKFTVAVTAVMKLKDASSLEEKL